MDSSRSQADGLNITSQVGVGTTITLMLPRIEQASPASGSDLSVDETEHSLQILVVDDDREMRGVVCATLIDLGHTVLAAESADLALILMGSTSIDLVLTDLAMPNVDGLELARRIRAKHDRVPILFHDRECRPH